MPGNFSRWTFDPAKRFSSVRMQQGRVQLDADWNEQVDIAQHDLRVRTRDLVGAASGPADAAGFELEATFALVFDGTGRFVAVPPHPRFAFGGRARFTLEAVIQPAPGAATGTVIAAYDREHRGWFALRVDGRGRVRFHRGHRHGPVCASPPLDWTRPLHVAAVYDGDTASLWVDGELFDQTDDPHPLEDAVEVVVREQLEVEEIAPGVALLEVDTTEEIIEERLTVLIGAGGPRGPHGGFFQGSIADVRIWRDAMPAGELAASVGLPVEVDHPLLVAAWALDDGAGHRVDEAMGAVGRIEHADTGAKPGPIWRPTGYYLGAGRYYVDGVLCENPSRIRLEQQPDDPGDPLPTEPGLYTAALEVWEHVVTADEDPALREVALGGPDTTVRTRTVWQVRLVRLGDDPDADDPGDKAPAWRGFHAGRATSGGLRARRRPDVATELPGNTLYRVEIHDRGERAGGPLWPDPASPRLSGRPASGHDDRVEVTGGALDPAIWFAGRWVEIVAASERVLTRLIAIEPDAEAPRLHAGAPVPRGGGLTVRAIASYKWARDNASDALPIRDITGRVVELRAPVEHGRGRLAAGDWVEVVNARAVVSDVAPRLHRVTSISDDRLAVTLDDDLAIPVAPGAWAVLQRWDDAETEQPAPVREGWLELEHGLQIELAGTGFYARGAHWLLASRVELGTVEWPQVDGAPAVRPPLGLHHACRLALIRVADEETAIEDLRHRFSPLVARSAAVAPPGAPPPAVLRDVAQVRELRVDGVAHVGGVLTARMIHGELADGTVGTDAIADDAVTARQLAPRSVHVRHLGADLGLLPAGYSILGDTPQPPTGFVYTHRQIEVANPMPSWQPRTALPGAAGRVVLVTAGETIYALLDDGEVWRFRETDDAWHPVTGLRAGAGFAAVVVGPALHILGGVDEHGRPSARHEVLDLISLRSHAARELPTPRAHLGAAAVDGEIIAIGGITTWPGARRHGRWTRHASGVTERYDVAEDRWRRVRAMPTARSHAGVGVLHGRVHVVGGLTRHLFRHRHHASAAHEVYLPEVDRWEHRTPLPEARGELGVAALEGRLFALGGAGARGIHARVDSYLPLVDSWHPGPELPAPRSGHGATALYGEIYAVGGHDADRANRVAWSAAVATTLFVHRKTHHVASASVLDDELAAPRAATPAPATAPAPVLAPPPPAPPAAPTTAAPAPRPPAAVTSWSAAVSSPGGARPVLATTPAHRSRAATFLMALGLAVLIAIPIGAAATFGGDLIDWLRGREHRAAPDARVATVTADARVATVTADAAARPVPAVTPDASPPPLPSVPLPPITPPAECADLARGAPPAVELHARSAADIVGIDVSEWDGEFAWRTLRSAGVHFTYIKATEGTGFRDLRFTANFDMAGRCGLLRGVYHFYVPTEDPAAQAAYLLKTIGDRRGELPTVIDVERALANHETTATCEDYQRGVTTMVDALERALGKKPMIYSSARVWQEQFCNHPGFSDLPLWVAWRESGKPRLPAGWNFWQFWQYTDQGTVGTAKLDVNYWSGTLEQLRDFAGLPR